MSRGRQLKTKIKEVQKLEEARVIGEAKGLIKARKMKYKFKNLIDVLKEKIFEISGHDLLKYGAILGATITIKNGLELSESLAGNVSDIFWIFKLIPNIEEIEQDVTKQTDKPELEIIEWLISLALAYLIIENFGEIITALGSGMTSILALAKSLLAL